MKKWNEIPLWFNSGWNDAVLFLSQKIAFLCPRGCPGNTSGLHLGHFADLGYWYIPPAIIRGHTFVAIVLNINYRCAVARSHFFKSFNEIGVRLSFDDVST